MVRQWKLGWALGLLALVGTAGWASREYFGGPPTGAKYRLAAVEPGEIAAYVSATGTLNPVIMVQVSTQVSGTIEHLFADYNAAVQDGQIIAQLDQASFRAKVAQAEASLENARADLKNAQANVGNVAASIDSARAEVATQRANVEQVQVDIAEAQRELERQRTLFARQLIARRDLDTAQSGADAARARRHAASAQVEKAQAQAALEQARVDLDRTVIRSPITGTVISRNVDIGQTVAASLQAPTLFTIAQDLTHMQVDTHVSEADIGSVAVGQPATFTVDAFPHHTFQGTVREIRQAPIVVQNVANYNTVIAVDNPERTLRPGMTATVVILVARREQARKLPKAALRFQPKLSEEARAELEKDIRERRDGGAREEAVPASEAQRRCWQSTPLVWMLTPEGFLRPAVVRLGISDDQFTELLGDSLREGQEVVIGVMDKAGPGDAGASRQSTTSGPPRLRF